jgi:glycosyltransferase involved in cell wall biosynthesis
MLRCLGALLAQDHPDFEVLVCDNGSTDGTPEAAAALGVRVERVDGTVGRVRNEGARRAEGSLIAFTDSDCLPAPGWLTALERAFEDERVGVVQGRTLPEVEPSAGWAATIRIEEFTGRYESCNVAYRADALRSSAGFDESGYGWEDTGAGYAVRRGGWLAAFAPDALVHHDVTYPGFWWRLKRAEEFSFAPAVAARYPEMRRELMTAGVFLRPRNARFAAALAGVALARRAPGIAAALATPYALERANMARDPKAVAQNVVYDAAVAYWLARGSLRHRSLVL